ncbi:uncharacterized protein [Littorina saxatilis]|uniref:uncharacterized protein n=1 Tax=Littorina saxatilis TaxID=31220 RepID=UPI0038B60974
MDDRRLFKLTDMCQWLTKWRLSAKCPKNFLSKECADDVQNMLVTFPEKRERHPQLWGLRRRSSQPPYSQRPLLPGNQHPRTCTPLLPLQILPRPSNLLSLGDIQPLLPGNQHPRATLLLLHSNLLSLGAIQPLLPGNQHPRTTPLLLHSNLLSLRAIQPLLPGNQHPRTTPLLLHSNLLSLGAIQPLLPGNQHPRITPLLLPSNLLRLGAIQPPPPLPCNLHLVIQSPPPLLPGHLWSMGIGRMTAIIGMGIPLPPTWQPLLRGCWKATHQPFYHLLDVEQSVPAPSASAS